MAATIDIGTDPDRGIYGLYEDFIGFIGRTGGTVYKLSYRVRLTFGATGETIVRDVVPNSSEEIAVNIIDPMKDYFKQQFTGESGGFFVSDGEILDYAFNTVQIEVGEVSASSATTPPTFGGYDTSDTIWVYNGYLDDAIFNTTSTYVNIRDPFLHNTSPIRLPLVNTESVYMINEMVFNDNAVLPMFSYIPFVDTGVDKDIYPIEIDLTYSNPSGLVATDTITLPTFPAYGTGIYVHEIGSDIDLTTYPTATRCSATVVYSNGADTYNSQSTVYDLQPCQPKYLDCMISWANRYSAPEQLPFNMKKVKRVAINRGKNITSDNIDIDAASLGTSKNPLSPRLRSFGQSARLIYTLNSEYLNEHQVEALTDLFKSSNVIMAEQIEKGGLLIKRSVKMQSTNYEIKDVKDGLVKVSIQVEVLDGNKIQNQ